MAEAKFHGVDLGWMQAQWRDCRDKAAQLAIFQDMVGKSVPVQEILDAVGEPEYCGPVDRTPKIVHKRRWTPKDDARIAELVREGRTYSEIAAEFGVKSGNIGWRISWLRSRGMIPPSENPEGKTEKADAEPEIPSGKVLEKVPEKADAEPEIPSGKVLEKVPEKADTEPEIVTELLSEPEDVYPDGGALPLEIGDLPGAEALEQVGTVLRALLDEEEMLCDRLEVVRDTIAAYRERLRELLTLAGGGQDDD